MDNEISRLGVTEISMVQEGEYVVSRYTAGYGEVVVTSRFVGGVTVEQFWLDTLQDNIKIREKSKA